MASIHGQRGGPLRYLMDTNDRFDTVCAALDMVTAKDVRGR